MRTALATVLTTLLASPLLLGCEITGITCNAPHSCMLPNLSAANPNRATNPADGSNEWPITPDTTLFDGIGGAHGIIKSPSVRLNYGQRKVIGGDAHVYAFAVEIESGAGASGWIVQSAVEGDVESMPTVSAEDPGKGDYEAPFVVTGGDPAAFGDLKVDPDFDGSHEAASDYLRRDDDVVNLLYNLPGVGGVATDTLPLGVRFHRSRGVASVERPLYHPGSREIVRTMRFVYGHIGTRWGWIAYDALTEEPAATP